MKAEAQRGMAATKKQKSEDENDIKWPWLLGILYEPRNTQNTRKGTRIENNMSGTVSKILTELQDSSWTASEHLATVESSERNRLRERGCRLR